MDTRIATQRLHSPMLIRRMIEKDVAILFLFDRIRMIIIPDRNLTYIHVLYSFCIKEKLTLALERNQFRAVSKTELCMDYSSSIDDYWKIFFAE